MVKIANVYGFKIVYKTGVKKIKDFKIFIKNKKIKNFHRLFAIFTLFIPSLSTFVMCLFLYSNMGKAVRSQSHCNCVYMCLFFLVASLMMSMLGRNM
jgi:hypothetical protein